MPMPLGSTSPLKALNAAKHSVKIGPRLDALMKRRSPDPIPGPDPALFQKWLRARLFDVQAVNEDAAKPGPPLEKSAYEGILRSFLAVNTAALLTVNTVGALETLLSFASAAKPGPMPGRYLEYLNKSDSVPLSLRATRAAVIREAAFKCSGLAGLPRTINGLNALRDALDDDVRGELDKSLPQDRTHDVFTDKAPREEVQRRGGELFDLIYAPVTSKLITRNREGHPDLPGWILENEYGASLANRPTPDSTPPLISRTLVSAIAVACLRAQGHVGPQLKSHVLGLLKAHHETGAEKTQSQHERWLSSEPGAEWVIQTVDGLCALVEDAGKGDDKTKAKL